MRLNMKLQFRFKREEIEKYMRENKIRIYNLAYFWGINIKNANKILNEKPFKINTIYLSEYSISDEEASTKLNDLIRKN